MKAAAPPLPYRQRHKAPQVLARTVRSLRTFSRAPPPPSRPRSAQSPAALGHTGAGPPRGDGDRRSGKRHGWARVWLLGQEHDGLAVASSLGLAEVTAGSRAGVRDTAEILRTLDQASLGDILQKNYTVTQTTPQSDSNLCVCARAQVWSHVSVRTSATVRDRARPRPQGCLVLPFCGHSHLPSTASPNRGRHQHAHSSITQTVLVCDLGCLCHSAQCSGDSARSSVAQPCPCVQATRPPAGGHWVVSSAQGV